MAPRALTIARASRGRAPTPPVLVLAVFVLAVFALTATAVAQTPPGHDGVRRAATHLEPQGDALSRLAVERRPDRSLVLDASDAPRKLDIAEFEARDAAGRTLALSKSTDGKFSVADAGDQWVFVHPKTPEPMQIVKGRQWLPGFALSPGSSSGGSAVISSYIEFSTAPIVWDIERDAYRLLAQIGAVRADDPTRSGKLEPVAEIRVAFEGITGAEPRALSISELGIGGERPLELMFSTASSATPRLVLRSSLSGEQPFALDVAPRIALTVAADSILGCGAEKVRVTAQAVAPNGVLVSLGSPTELLVRGEGLLIEDADELKLPPSGGTVAFAARSKVLGHGRIVATARTSSADLYGSVSLEQRAPWLQLCIAVAGGALGGYVRRFVKGARKNRNARRVIEGLVVGLIMFVAASFGVGYGILPAPLVATLAGAFLTGATMGFAGVVALERLTAPKA